MITAAFLPKSEVMSILPEFVEDVFKIERSIIEKQLMPIFDILDDCIICFIEFPYVEKYYRDSYYSFFSKKHNSSKRNSIRISFFNQDLDSENYFNIDDIVLKNSFHGYITLRPTTYKIIGHSFISPRILKNKDFVCCLSKKTVSILGRLLSIDGFPYCNQDNESITCSEASIINLMDYFSHKYPEYSTVLPSQVVKILSKQSYQRQLPAHGLPTESLSYVLKKIGFGTVVYSSGHNNKSSELYKYDDFKELLYIYIESGIPIIATLSSKNGYHAVLVIGRENISKKIQFKRSFVNPFSSNSLMFSKAFSKVLIMNDNDPPYEMVDFKKPLFDEDSKSQYNFSSFIVPLYPKVFLEAYQFKVFFFQVIKTLEKFAETKHVKFTQPNECYIYRFFLTSSKSYKNYIAKSARLSSRFKSITISKAMPKFIWVGEIIKGDSIDKTQTVESVIVVDATESGLYGHLVFATNSKFLIIKNSGNDLTDYQEIDHENKYRIFQFDNELFYTFANNLKGEHTQWQNS